MDLLALTAHAPGERERLTYREIHAPELLFVKTLSTKEIHVSTALQKLVNTLLAPGIHIKSKQLIRKLLHRRGKTRRPKKKRRREDSDSDEDSSSSEDEDDQGDRKEAKRTKNKRKADRDPDDDDEEDDEEEEKLSATERAVIENYEFLFLEFLRVSLFNILEYGFTPYGVSAHVSYGDFPGTFPLHDVRILYRVNKNLTYDMHYYSKKPTVLGMMGLYDTQLQTVGTWTQFGPNDGRLTSPVAELGSYVEDTMHLIRGAAAAELHLAFPTLVSTAGSNGSNEELKNMDTSKPTTRFNDSNRDAMLFDEEYARKQRQRESAVREETEDEVQAMRARTVGGKETTHTAPRSGDSVSWAYNIQELDGAADVKATQLKPTQTTVAEYHELLAQLVHAKLGMPFSGSSQSKGPLDKKSGSGKVAQPGADVRDPQMRTTMLRWGKPLRQFASFLLDSVCGISDAEIVFVSLIDLQQAADLLEKNCLKPDNDLKQAWSEATGISPRCFVSPAMVEAEAERVKIQLQAKADLKLEKQKGKIEDKKMKEEMKMKREEFKLKKQEIEMKIEFQRQELQIKMQEMKAKMQFDQHQMQMADEKQQHDIANAKAKTDADVRNKTLLAQTDAKAKAAVADATVEAKRKKAAAAPAKKD